MPIVGPIITLMDPHSSDTQDAIALVGLAGGLLPFVGELGEVSGAFNAAEAEPSAYSVAFEAKLTPQGIGTYGSHFAEANEQLLKAMADPETANALRSTLGADFEGAIVSPSGSVRGVSPEGWTWHHASEPGVLQLVPDFQHAPGSAWQPLLHPGGAGGMSIWGADY